ncbi:hypothetical protein DM455_09850 [Legionella pneumophila]|nr:hypothetical protein ULM_25630 [Legionella pneumophila]PYB44012.1 hypothetical protein DM454_09325 [Legionella pneumophila]PYB49865.1 hypothetical protein DM456_10580 [Legionella pneumophila]PYB62527.1 hypothetical protein DM455_09850 [Legionella pneumophila]TID58568.1 hypothetical protein DIZ40_11005 [Legionella pneumophila]
MFTYTAVVSIDRKEVQRESGDDLDSLFTWMMCQAQGKMGRYSGFIINNNTKKIVKRFRKCSID